MGIVWMALATWLPAAPALPCVFEPAELPATLPQGMSLSPERTLLLSGVNGILAEAPVAPRQRLRLTVRARVATGPSLEALPQIADLFGLMVWNQGLVPMRFPRLAFEFREKDGKRRRDELYSVREIAVCSREFQDLRLEFHVPDDAAAIRVLGQANAKENVLEVSAVRLEEVPADERPCLNINPDLRLGRYNPSGYGYMHRAQFFYDGTGVPGIDLGVSWGVGDYIPVTGGSRLRVRFGGKAHPDRQYFRLNATYYRDNGFGDDSEVGRNRLPMQVPHRQTEGEVELLAPPEARWMRLSFTWGVLRHVYVQEVE